MIRAFERAAQSVLAVLGEDALFAGTTRTKINVEHGVQFVGQDAGVTSSQYRGEFSVMRDVATLPAALNPRESQTFQFIDSVTNMPAGPTYRLEKLVDSNGYNKRFIILKVNS